MKKAIALVVVVVGIVGLLLVGARLYGRDTRTDEAVTGDRRLEPVAGSPAAHPDSPLAHSPTAHIAVVVTDDAGPVANGVRPSRAER